MKYLASAIAATMASTHAALANGDGPCAFGGCTNVPEISALEGTAAIAAVAALVLVAWERRRRAV